MQYPLNYSGTKCLSTENQNYQCSGGFHLKSLWWNHLPVPVQTMENLFFTITFRVFDVHFR